MQGVQPKANASPSIGGGEAAAPRPRHPAQIEVQPAPVQQPGHKQAEDDHDDTADQVGLLPVHEQEPSEGGGAGTERDEHGREAEHEGETRSEHRQPFPASPAGLQLFYGQSGDIGQVAGHER